jgi:hypothetical protein
MNIQRHHGVECVCGLFTAAKGAAAHVVAEPVSDEPILGVDFGGGLSAIDGSHSFRTFDVRQRRRLLHRRPTLIDCTKEGAALYKK